MSKATLPLPPSPCSYGTVPDNVLMVVANKLDLADQREVRALVEEAQGAPRSKRRSSVG